MIKKYIKNKISKKEKIWCVLIDPDKLHFDDVDNLVSLTNKCSCDFILLVAV